MLHYVRVQISKVTVTIKMQYETAFWFAISKVCHLRKMYINKNVLIYFIGGAFFIWFYKVCIKFLTCEFLTALSHDLYQDNK